MTYYTGSQAAAGQGGVLISIRTRFVRAILDGSKTFELRRKVPRHAAGLDIIVYSSGGDKAIVARAKVSEVATGTPEAIWNQFEIHLGVTRKEFDDYFLGAEVAHALKLENVTASQRPVPLTELRTDHGLEPPQSWRYLQADSYARLLATVNEDHSSH
ncbi:ASCH domain-containing protein [Arthrobacter sp. 260]|uniref:ASCH domain-containing protein n=1 Tax=Arthrobacter sp. 260 TaxID=2735314 RepID=UPI00149229A6|nr:ASCH domain-containing protein [Arthrobacter sp. 260]NOJ58980.1 hypothetical protein [Arthrobacter sp. 260]